MSTIQEITEEIHGKHGTDGLQKAARQFGLHTIERHILERSLQVYHAGRLEKRTREVTVEYADADFCLFQLDKHEDEPLVRENERDPIVNDPLPTWWLLGTDDLRESGLTLMEYPGKTEQINNWTRSDILDGIDLDGWQTVSRDQIRDLDYGTNYRLSGRLGITRLDPDDYLTGLQKSALLKMRYGSTIIASQRVS